MSFQKLDRTAFSATTAEEAPKIQAKYYKSLTAKQRGEIANYLNSIAFGYEENNPPKMDKTVFSVRSRG